MHITVCPTRGLEWPMRVALISDIHSNLAALDATLEAIEAARIDRVLCLGDVVSLGPLPHETLLRVREIGCPVVMGNCDDFMLHPKVDEGDDDNARISASDAWTADQLSDADLDYIRTFQATIELACGPYGLLGYHGSPQSFNDSIGPETSEEELAELLDRCGSDVFAGGHTHWQMLRRSGTSIVMNPGSVGMAYDRTRPLAGVKCAPWAEFAVLSAENGLSIDFRRVGYDSRSVARALEQSGMPHAEWLAEGWR